MFKNYDKYRFIYLPSCEDKVSHITTFMILQIKLGPQ